MRLRACNEDFVSTASRLNNGRRAQNERRTSKKAFSRWISLPHQRAPKPREVRNSAEDGSPKIGVSTPSRSLRFSRLACPSPKHAQRGCHSLSRTRPGKTVARHRNVQPEQRRELLDASPQLQELLPEFLLREVRHLQTDHDRRRRAEPPSRRRPRDTEICGDGQVPGALDKIQEPMVIALLRAGTRSSCG